MYLRALIVVALLCLSCPGHATFSDEVLKSVRSLQEDIFILSHRSINGADAAATWAIFDQDVLQSLNGGVLPLTAENLNQKYGLTDIRISLEKAGESGDMKTGYIRIEFYPLKSKTRDKPDWITVYYHGLGVVPSATFHIFHYKDGAYKLAAAMEQMRFLHAHPNLQWRAISLQMKGKSGSFDTHHTPVTSKERPNRSKISWHWNGKTLKPRSWIPEFDFHRKNDGTIVEGRGKSIKID